MTTPPARAAFFFVRVAGTWKPQPAAVSASGVRRRVHDAPICAHGFLDPGVQRFADQCMADRDFPHLRDGKQERSQIGLTQIMAGIDCKPRSLCIASGGGRGGECSTGSACGEGFGIGAGVQLDPVCAAGRGTRDLGVADIDEHTDAAALCLERRDQRAQGIAIANEIEAVVGGQLAVAVRYQGDLGRACRLAQGQQAGIAGTRRSKRIAFDVELAAAILFDQRRNRRDIAGADVAFVGARMNSDTRCTGIENDARAGDEIGQTVIAAVSEQGDAIDIGREMSHGRTQDANG